MATSKPHKPPARKLPAPGATESSGAGVRGVDTATKAAYTVGTTPILKDGVLHAPGDVIELTPAQAQRLGLEPFEVIDPNFPPLRLDPFTQLA